MKSRADSTAETTFIQSMERHSEVAKSLGQEISARLDSSGAMIHAVRTGGFGVDAIPDTQAI
ncbi:hypothetical protein OVY01_09590 [Robbsia sp. Bb-Pol-6]|uniref:Uncharacterized protein n=1 Tax=Robbsia betulipollinis TaxID=2981849 RepID=A0ABT3ZME0_9BURK|nr:hypothetical protein [Robbsia betulipollinis]MCY0387482.1 hypothetical protein [Robbsia betulipollinis]